MKHSFLWKPIAAIFPLLLLQLFVYCSFAFASEDYTITITVPSDENGPVTPGHSFFIGGTIESEQPLPDGAVLRISVIDANGDEVRFAECAQKDRDVVDRFTHQKR